MRGEVKFTQERTVAKKQWPEKAGYGENYVPMRDGGADSISDEGTLDQGATLMADRAQAALFAGEGEEEFVITRTLNHVPLEIWLPSSPNICCGVAGGA
jgi:hypothetical protein